MAIVWVVSRDREAVGRVSRPSYQSDLNWQEFQVEAGIGRIDAAENELHTAALDDGDNLKQFDILRLWPASDRTEESMIASLRDLHDLTASERSASAEETAEPRRPRKRNEETVSEETNRIEFVVRQAKRVPGFLKMNDSDLASALIAEKKDRAYKHDTLRRIVAGTYSPMKSRNIVGPRERSRQTKPGK
jgi:hypothetical protein